MDNGIYQITGAQPTPAASVADIVGIATASGLANSAWAADEEDFERLVDEAMSRSEPSLIAVRIDDKPGVGTTRRDPVQIRERFMASLGPRDQLLASSAFRRERRFGAGAATVTGLTRMRTDPFDWSRSKALVLRTRSINFRDP